MATEVMKIVIRHRVFQGVKCEPEPAPPTDQMIRLPCMDGMAWHVRNVQHVHIFDV